MPSLAHSTSSQPPRVVITGAGIITALGAHWNANAAGFAEGRCGFGGVRLFDASRYRARQAAQVPDRDVMEMVDAGRLPPRRVQRMDRAARLLLLAAREAIASARLDPPSVRGPLPVVVATTSAGMNSGLRYFDRALRSPNSRRGQPTRLDDYFVHRHLHDLEIDLGLRGPATALGNACASGANAVGHAWELLRARRAECAVAGGYDALNELVFAGFDSLQALSPTACRPFDRERDGLGLGEGAALLVLETLEHARDRGATILAELAGYGLATDLHHLTQPHPEGLGAAASMSAACALAGLAPADIDYINAHGTGTVLNDRAEALAIGAWAGEAVGEIPVSSTKASVGHLLGAAGAVEAVICVMALLGQWLPPTINVREPDAVCRFSVLQQARKAARLEAVLSNSFGFGGSNATLAFRRWHD